MKVEVEHFEIDGRKGSMAPIGNNLWKLIYEDGGIEIAEEDKDA